MQSPEALTGGRKGGGSRERPLAPRYCPPREHVYVGMSAPQTSISLFLKLIRCHKSVRAPHYLLWWKSAAVITHTAALTRWALRSADGLPPAKCLSN